jgi:hypothetical protein
MSQLAAQGADIVDGEQPLTDVKRASKALRMMRLARLVAVSHYERNTCFWSAE